MTEIQMLITREPVEESVDLLVAVEVEVDAAGVRPSSFGTDLTGRQWGLSETEMDKAAQVAWEMYHEE